MSWTAPAFLDEFGDRLEARIGLVGVKVFRAPVEQIEAEENIVFVRVAGTQEWAVIGNQPRNDEYQVECSIVVSRQGSGDAIAKEARDRAQTLLQEVEDDITELMASGDVQSFSTALGASQLLKLNLARINLNQWANQNNERVAQIDFDIELSARI